MQVMAPTNNGTTNGNGDLTRLRTKEELNEDGCAYGQVNRARIVNVEDLAKDINQKLWMLVCMVIVQLVGFIFVLLKDANIVKGFGG